MSFVKGMIIGGIVTAGVTMMYSDTIEQNKKRMLKKGKKLVKKMWM